MTANTVDTLRGPVVNGRFRVEAPMAHGAQALSYHAYDLQLKCACVMKFSLEARQGAELGAEFRHLRGLDHPHIVRALDVGRALGPEPLLVKGAGEDVDLGGRAYLALEHVKGPNLLKAAPAVAALDRPRWLWQLACHLADALAYLHARHLLHGDLTPANVAITGLDQAVLLDFGLAWRLVGGVTAKTGSRGQGTLGFASPEALAGGLGPRSDLFGLGATLYWAWCQQVPYGEGANGVARLLAGQPPTKPAQHREGLPSTFESLLLQLVASAPKDRPADAVEVLRRLLRLGADNGWGAEAGAAPDSMHLAAALAPATPSGDVLAGVFVGRQPELAAVDATLADLQHGRSRVNALVISGPPGFGRHTLLQEALARAKLRGLAQGLEFTVTTLGRLMSAQPLPATRAGDPAQQATNQWAQALAAADLRARQAPLVVIAEAANAEPLVQRLRLMTSQAAGRCLFVVIADARLATESDTVAHVPLDAFSQQDVASLLAAAALPHDRSTAQPLWQACEGHPALAALLVRQRRAGFTLGSPVANTEPVGAFRAQFRSLGGAAQAAIVAVWWDLASAVDLDGAQVAVRAGWLKASAAGALSVPSGLQRQALWGIWDTSEHPPEAAVTALAAAASSRLAPQDARRAEALRVMGRTGEAFADFLAAASARWLRFDSEGALWCWQQAEATDDGSVWPQDHITWRAQALGLVSRYDAAEVWLQSQPTPNPVSPQVEVARAELRSWLSRRQGDLEGAGRWLASAEARLQNQPHAGDETKAALARLQVRRARLLVSQGRHQDALALAATSHADDEPIQLVQWETQALASAYLGQWVKAETAVRALERHAGAAGEEQAGRVAAVRGLLSQLQQDLALSALAYRKASAHFERAGDVHGRSNALLNLAMVLAEQGRNADSLACFQSAYQGLLHVGAAADATAAAFNAGLLFARLGDDKASAAAEQQVRQASKALNTQAAGAWIETLSAARQWHRRAWTEAALAHERAAALFAASGDPMRTCWARLAACEAWGLARQLAPAHAALKAAAEVPPALQRNLAWARARLALAGDPQVATSPLALQLSQAAQSDHQRQRVVDGFRSAALAAQLFHHVGEQEQARAQARLALQWLKEIHVNTPPEYQAALAQDSDAAWLTRLPEMGSAAGESQPGLVALAQKLSHAEARLRRFVRLSKRLNSELRLPRLLETVLDTVIELTEAERGFLLLREAQGELVVRAARNIDQTSLEGQALAFSRSIAEQVARTGTPVITVDAAADDRFAQALSVSDLQLRSVVAVPLTVKGQVEGTIYVDNRLRHGAFTEDDVATLLEFAELAALAIGNTRLIAELKRRDRQIETLNRRLQADLAARKDEISVMRVQLTESRESFALRFDYHNLIGRSPRMMEMLRLIDRISETNLPVVIQGESGTGKELVARALVANGVRKDKAFVTENCAAIPETLLESTLFGYVRGAFTGADKDTRGLFAAAHEGTLFLDEVGEMSPALQGKLLRVLQEGEYRRVGAQRNERTDVRVIVATNRDLEAMVREGRFRQDLFYRLAVVRVHLPPLRERLEDIPLLVRHFLQVWQGRAGIKANNITPDALARLCAYAWPGNVRELENEIGRAAAFASATISSADLSSHIAGGGADRTALEPAGNDLRLKPQVERLEKTLLREALARCDGNQTRAAEGLGLSRFGLQKKLKRYGMEG